MTAKPGKIDAHCHVCADHEESRLMLETLGLRLLNISLGTDPVGKWRAEPLWGSEAMSAPAVKYPGLCGWVTAFDEPRFNDAGWADSVISGLESDFNCGAVAVKMWRNIGLKVRRPGIGNILPDDPVFEPVLAWLEGQGRTLVIHVGEPAEAWKPLDPAGQRYAHYLRNPGEHFHGKTDIPPYAELIAARDHILERYPSLRVVGCHLGSMEHDVREVAAHFDRYPNFAVDTSARVPDLAGQDHGLVRDFFLKYPDRLLWGTDSLGFKPHSSMTPAERADSIRDLARRWTEDAEYFESGGEVSYLGWGETPVKLRGLGLPAGVLDGFFRGNSLKWYPGLFSF